MTNLCIHGVALAAVCPECPAAAATAELQVNDVVAFVKEHPWHGCVAIVYEVKSFGACVEVRDPRGGEYPIRCKREQIIRIGRLP